MAITSDEVLDLPVADRLRLVAEIWETIVEDPDSIELSPETKELLQKRYQRSLEQPEEGVAWEVVKDRLLSK